MRTKARVVELIGRTVRAREHQPLDDLVTETQPKNFNRSWTYSVALQRLRPCAVREQAVAPLAGRHHRF
jgi:hypothetical protein